MFFEQTNEYTITADSIQWTLIWHPKGPKYSTSDGKQAVLPNGSKTYYGSLSALSRAVIDRRARECGSLKEISDSLDAIKREALAITNRS